jgi:hypothetical protein
MRLHLIATTEIDATPVSAVEFNVSALPEEYVDLVIYASVRSTQSIPYFWEGFALSFNNNSGTWRACKVARNNGAPYGAADNSGSTFSYWAGTYTSSNSTAGAFGNTKIIIPDWRRAHEKPVISEGASPTLTTSGQVHTASRWLSSDTITSIKLQAGQGFSQYSSVSLYGVTAGTGGVTVTT